MRSMATLAYDCRRAEMFRGQLFDALRLIDRGDLAAPEMIGSWAGELGQTQMMPTEYIKYAVDYDGDGKRNLLRSAADVIGSTGNYRSISAGSAASHGCRRSASHRTCPGKRPGSTSNIRARNGPNGA